MTTSWWCENAWLPEGIVAGVRIDVDRDRIVAVVRAPEPGRDSRRLYGLVMPGLANVHSHAFHRALRSYKQQENGDFWSWREQMYVVAERLDPDNYLTLARAVYAEMALAGITAVGEFHYLHHAPGGIPYADPNAMGYALIEAAKDAGIRLTLLDTCYLTGGFDQPLSEPQRRFSDGDAMYWAERASVMRKHSSPTVRIGAAIHSVRAVPLDQMPTVAAWKGLPLHVHLSEQQAENEGCMAMYGRTPASLLGDAGVLGPRTTAVHATHLTRGDLELLQSTGTGVCLCPTTERDLADGIGLAVAMAQREIPLSFGSDSHAVIDIFEEARVTELDERLITARRGNISADILARAAINHASLGFEDAGQLERGKLADFIAVDLMSVRTAGGGPALETIVFAASAADVTDVVVGGRAIVSDRQHVSIGDVGRLLAAAISPLLAD